MVPRLSRARVRAGARRPLDGPDGGSSVQPVLRFQWEAFLRIQRREPELIAARTKAFLMVAREQGFAFDCAVGSMLEIWHDAWVTGQCADDRIAAFRSALAELRRIGIRIALGWWYALFAECLEKQGNTDEALASLEAAVVHFERRGSDAHGSRKSIG